MITRALLKYSCLLGAALFGGVLSERAEESVLTFSDPPSYSVSLSDTILYPDAKLYQRRSTVEGIGASVSLTERWALIGAPDHQEGAAHVFERSNNGKEWRLHTTFLPPELNRPGGKFGASVSLSGNRAIIGAPGYHPTGAAWIYKFDKATGEWREDAKLTLPMALPDAAEDSRFDFGASVALDGDRAVIGMQRWSDSRRVFAGAAFIFRRNVATGDWRLEGRLTPEEELRSHSRFGYDVDLAGNLVVVGTRGYSRRNPAGRIRTAYFYGGAFVFRWDDTKRSWVQDQLFLLEEPGRRERFGSAVAINGNRIIVGAPTGGALGSEPTGRVDNSNPGVVYSYTYDSSNGRWIKEERFLLARAGNDARFGSSLALSQTGDTAVIGADNNRGATDFSGTAHLYVFNQAVGAWERRFDLMARDPSRRFEIFGRSVAYVNGQVLVGAPNHSAENHDGAGFIFNIPQ